MNKTTLETNSFLDGDKRLGVGNVPSDSHGKTRATQSGCVFFENESFYFKFNIFNNLKCFIGFSSYNERK